MALKPEHLTSRLALPEKVPSDGTTYRLRAGEIKLTERPPGHKPSDVGRPLR